MGGASEAAHRSVSECTFFPRKRPFLRLKELKDIQDTMRPQTHVPDYARPKCRDLLKSKPCPNFVSCMLMTLGHAPDGCERES